MPRFEGCLLDYGNTVIEFDDPQITWIFEKLVPLLEKRLGAVDVRQLKRAMARVMGIPHGGQPPSFRELPPLDLMRRFLREVYGEDSPLDGDLVKELDGELQDLFVASIELEPEVGDVLDGLRRRIRLGLVSNYSCGESLRRSLRTLGIEQLFDPVVVSGDVGLVKPHEKVFLTALEALSLEPGSVLFVGDRWDIDLVGSMNAGMRTCHHLGYTRDRDLEERYRSYRPDYTIEHLRDLWQILEE